MADAPGSPRSPKRRRVGQATDPVSPTGPTTAAVAACRLPKTPAKADRLRIRQDITLDNRTKFFELNRYPITEQIEQRMEQVSSIVTKERYARLWDPGVYSCSRCSRRLYDGAAKFVGPCLWPSFREATSEESLELRLVPKGSYNQYQCEVHEIYCRGCQLFLGHRFEDGATTGDSHPRARYRHCVLSLSLAFEADPVVVGIVAALADRDDGKVAEFVKLGAIGRLCTMLTVPDLPTAARIVDTLDKLIVAGQSQPPDPGGKNAHAAAVFGVGGTVAALERLRAHDDAAVRRKAAGLLSFNS